MIKIGQKQGWFKPEEIILEKNNIKKIGIQINRIDSTIAINDKTYQIGNTNMLQFDNLTEKEIIIINNNDNDIFVIIDYEERIDE